jgi:hypothetical protein
MGRILRALMLVLRAPVQAGSVLDLTELEPTRELRSAGGVEVIEKNLAPVCSRFDAQSARRELQFV